MVGTYHSDCGCDVSPTDSEPWVDTIPDHCLYVVIEILTTCNIQ